MALGSVLIKYFLYPVIIGIISTVCYVLLFDNLLKQILLPWYFSRKYKSTLIDGEWFGKTEGFSFYMNLKQAGDKVSGEMTVESIWQTEAKDKKGSFVKDTNTYIFEGEIKDGFVRLIHREKDRNSFGFGCFMFEIAGGGKNLNGSVIFVDESSDNYSIETSTGIKLVRK